MEPLVLSAPKAPCRATLGEATVGLSPLKPKADAPQFAHTHTHSLSLSLVESSKACSIDVAIFLWLGYDTTHWVLPYFAYMFWCTSHSLLAVALCVDVGLVHC